MSNPTGSRTHPESLERALLAVILLVVGTLAGLASFTHVHDWTMHNSPVGTPDWFGWANAAISELTPIAALLEVRQRRRHGGDIRYPMLLLVAAVALSLAAQFAVAKPGLSGWLLSAVPALAFMGLSKLVLSSKVYVDTPASVAPVDAKPAEVAPPAEPAVAVSTARTESASPTPSGTSAARKTLDRTHSSPTRPRPRSLTSAAKVQAVAAKMPDATPAEVAAKAGVSESTARRYMPGPGVSVPSPTRSSPGDTRVNGRKPAVVGVRAR